MWEGGWERGGGERGDMGEGESSSEPPIKPAHFDFLAKNKNHTKMAERRLLTSKWAVFISSYKDVQGWGGEINCFSNLKKNRI